MCTHTYPQSGVLIGTAHPCPSVGYQEWPRWWLLGTHRKGFPTQTNVPRAMSVLSHHTIQKPLMANSGLKKGTWPWLGQQKAHPLTTVIIQEVGTRTQPGQSEPFARIFPTEIQRLVAILSGYDFNDCWRRLFLFDREYLSLWIEKEV